MDLEKVMPTIMLGIMAGTDALTDGTLEFQIVNYKQMLLDRLILKLKAKKMTTDCTICNQIIAK